MGVRGARRSVIGLRPAAESALRSVLPLTSDFFRQQRNALNAKFLAGPFRVVRTHSEGFSYFVTSIAAPVASGWSVRRVGFAPTGKRRLSTAHANNRLTQRSKQISSFNHLVSLGEHQNWDLKAEGVSGLEIDHQFYLGALLDWEVSRLGALENFSDVDPCLLI